jgi:hypothetical protein
MLKELLNIFKTGINLHPSNERLETTHNSVNRAYLNLGISNVIEDPEIPLF